MKPHHAHLGITKTIYRISMTKNAFSYFGLPKFVVSATFVQGRTCAYKVCIHSAMLSEPIKVDLRKPCAFFTMTTRPHLTPNYTDFS